MKAGNIISFGGKRSGEQTVRLREGYQGTINACRQLMVKALPQRTDALFERLDDVLYDLTNKAETDQQQEAYFESLRILRRERGRVESVFNKGVLGRFDRFWTQGPGTILDDDLSASFSSEEMGLVESDDLEEGLAITGIISKGNNGFYRDLYALDQRFSYLLNGLKIEEDQNPLSPASFCAAFKQAIATLAVNLSVRLVIYKQFEKEVISHLGPVYDQVNATLAKAGIMPEIRPIMRRRSGSATPNTPTHAEGGDEEASYSEAAHAAIQAEVFSTIQKLLSQRRPVEQKRSGAIRYVDSTDLLSALSALQHQNKNVVGEVMDAGTVRTVLLQMPQIGQSANEGTAIGRVDEDTIDIISMLFEFILDDPGLSDPMRALLARLQIPMLKVAIADKSFFSRKDHPARRLLNGMAQAAIGWTEQSGRKGDSLYNHIDSVVGRILSEFDDNLGLFEELNEQFTAYLEREQRGAKVAEERAAQVTQGKEALIEAKRQVAEEIGRCLSEYKSIPDVVQNLVRDGWNDVLLLIYLRQGQESQEWIDAVQVMDRLVWSVMPKPTRNERQELLRSIPDLLKRLRAGLSDISYNQHKMTRTFKALQARHLACLRGTRAVEELERGQREKGGGASAGNDNVMEEIVLESAGSSDSVEREQDKFDELAASLKVGTWLELTESDGSVVRAKLSWRSGVSGNCLFVNRKGMKVADVTQQGLGVWLRTAKAAILPVPDLPLMDRALTSMMDNLSKSSSKTQGDSKEKGK